MFDGRAIGLQLRALIRALFNFPPDQPGEAVGGTFKATFADNPRPEPQSEDDGSHG